MEISHRSKEFETIVREAQTDLRELMGIPSNYKILFLQGGASLMFAMVPMNFRSADASADYIVTGTWSKKAFKESQKLGNAKAAANLEADNFDHLPVQAELKLLRLPALSEVDEVVRLTQVSLNSQVETVRDLSRAASAQGVTHRVILMIETDDWREGVMPEREVERWRDP